MTINDAVALAAEHTGENIGREKLIFWLSQIENTVVTEIAATHENDTSDKTVITDMTDGDRVLFAPDPYSVLYVNYLIMKTDLALRDSAQYQNSSHAFAVSYADFADWYNRTYMPYSESRIKL